MDSDTLAQHLFQRNEKDQPVVLTIPNLEDSFQLFSFCVHMTTQGLVMNSETNLLEASSIDIESIPIERIEYVGRKLENAGIKMLVSIEPADPEITVPQIQMRNKTHVKSIRDIALFLLTPKATYVLTYELVRKIGLVERCHAAEKIDTPFNK